MTNYLRTAEYLTAMFTAWKSTSEQPIMIIILVMTMIW
jgi:hypothetical protein